MVSPFDQLRAKMNAIRAGMPLILSESVRESAPVIEDEIIGQLKRGERGDGSMLPDYSPVSVSVYGKRPGPMTLEDTGDFHRAIVVVADESGFAIMNNDWKAPKLAFHYGSEILEIQTESFDIIKRDILTPVMIANINRFIAYGSI